MSTGLARRDDQGGGGGGNSLGMATVGPRNSGLAVSAARQAQEVQAAVIMAKQFPRCFPEVEARIRQTCQRVGLAEQALYSYPRGGSKIEGPSIRLAEALAQNYGNIDVGVIELEQRNGESIMMAYAWDLETNTRETKTFVVPHERKANGRVQKLDDPRDIYEHTANQGSRRLRACILAVIPGDLVDMAVDECNQTLAHANSGKPLAERIRNMVAGFAELGVTAQEIEARLQHSTRAMTEQELIAMGKIYSSLKDGYGKKADYFKPVSAFGGGAGGPGSNDDGAPENTPAPPPSGRQRQRKQKPQKPPVDPPQDDEGGGDDSAYGAMLAAFGKHGISPDDATEYLSGEGGPGWLEDGQTLLDLSDEQMATLADGAAEFAADVYPDRGGEGGGDDS